MADNHESLNSSMHLTSHDQQLDEIGSNSDKVDESNDGPDSTDGHDDFVEDQWIIVSFEEDDPEHPHNWPNTKKFYVVFGAILLVFNSTLGSSLPSGGITETLDYFHMNGVEWRVLPNSIYIVGYILGPIFFSPLSEQFGRWIVLSVTFFIYTVFTLGCALSPNFAALIVFRLLAGCGASTGISVIGGIFADIFKDPRARGISITLFMFATTWGPLVGPIIAGFVSVVSWRWPYWIALIIAGITWIFWIFVPETYAATILERKAKEMRRATGDAKFVAPTEVEKTNMEQLVKVVLMRPIRMFFLEPIVTTACIYLAIIYGIFYMEFPVYPLVFEDIYHFNAGENGLAFLPIGVGALLACAIFLWHDSYLRKSKARDPPPKWTELEEYNRLPLACIGGPFFAVSMFWLGWSARNDVSWVAPLLSGVFFGTGYLLIFMGKLNYLVDAYAEYAASALGASAAIRSLFAVWLPFLSHPLYTNLGIDWGSSLLGFISVVMCITPFIFIRYGGTIRKHSRLCQELVERKRIQAEEAEKKRADSKISLGQPVDESSEKAHEMV